ncbi:hypothetical protein [Aequorivita sp. CIP111184]|uniref:hypothetical protein n=1 Tax=Aequorivita sp. CIP111184 TaxID=2211356 RepID=UPI000DBC4594|nr:hypothetical protein [Aequorivita sp. CIP111184]SRX52750.1 hypothetical protein AEQU1_00620 [Aequorivita sp. CIP111184]
MKNLIIIFLFFTIFMAQGQEEVSTQKVWRVNFINPGVEVEVPVTKNSTFSTNLGVGFNGAYPDLVYGEENGIIYIIAPFVDLQFKQFYNFERRVEKGKSISGNSGNFISARIISRGPSIADNVIRKSDVDIAIGPTWGIQREFGNVQFLFDLGPQFYFDINGNNGFWPLMAQLNIGLNLNSNKM